MPGFRRQHNFIDKVNGIGNAGILSNGTVREIRRSVGKYRNVFQQSVPADSLPDIRFFFLAQINTLGITTAFVIEHAVIIPAVLVVSNKVAFGIGR